MNTNIVYELHFRIPLLRQRYPSVPILLAGSKVDYHSDPTVLQNPDKKKRLVTIEQVERIAYHMNAADYVLFSSKTGLNLQKLFQCAIAIAREPQTFGLPQKSERSCIVS
jgi:hypothetical protein